MRSVSPLARVVGPAERPSPPPPVKAAAEHPLPKLWPELVSTLRDGLIEVQASQVKQARANDVEIKSAADRVVAAIADIKPATITDAVEKITAVLRELKPAPRTSWRFDVKRDDKGGISEVTAHPIGSK
jgi:hypothetical protein